MIVLVAWVLVLVASIVGLSWRDPRPHAVSLAVAIVMLILLLTHGAGVR